MSLGHSFLVFPGAQSVWLGEKEDKQQIAACSLITLDVEPWQRGQEKPCLFLIGLANQSVLPLISWEGIFNLSEADRLVTWQQCSKHWTF